MRKLVIIAASFAALAISATAMASVAVDNGVGFVGKGDVQTALGWNNAAFDKGVDSLKFTAGAEKVIADYKMSCFNGSTGAIDEAVGHRIISQPGAATVTATQVLNSNGKQITGFNLTGNANDFTNVGNRVLRDTGCPEGSVLFMNTGGPTQPNTVSITGGLRVNGVDLPNTPVALTV